MKNKQKNGKKSYLYIIFLALAFIILLGTGAYAYYQTTITGTISGSVAKWSFTANNQTSTFNIDFGSLYPGKTGEYAIELSAEDSDLPVAFELIVSAENFGLMELFGAIFYRDSAYNNMFFPILKGYIMPGEKATIPLYMNWPYEGIAEITGADDDNVIYNSINNIIGNDMLTSWSVTIIGRQIDKSSSEAFDDGLGSDLLGLTDISNCSNGTYDYPNKYGWPCDIFESGAFDLNVPVITGGKTINYPFDNGVSSQYYNWAVFSYYVE